MSKIVPVILCGGAGSRLWPLSRSGFPKQFLCISGTKSLFQETVERMQGGLVDAEALSLPIIVSNEEHRFIALEQLKELGGAPGALLLEPVGRNTAPALTLAALQAQEGGGDPVLVVTPADHAVNDRAAFQSSLRIAIAEAEADAIAILGIKPTHPETGYGYIKARMSENSIVGALSVDAFVEKPIATVAEKYLRDGSYFWNAGVFIVKASVWLNALQQLRPDILNSTMQSWELRSKDASFVRPSKEQFIAVPSESVDYAVIEHCNELGVPLKVVPVDAGWSDLGAWDSVWKALPKDSDGNAVNGDVILHNANNVLVHATSRLVGVVGLNNVAVIETQDAVLVVSQDQCQDVKKLVSHLEASGREEHQLHRKVHRPWGWYDSIDEGDRFKVKRIQVKPGASLSLQKHFHRAEHWVVVTGTALITNGAEEIVLAENESTFIPLGIVHRLTNPGRIPLEIIEVQSGSYLGEDDIVRLEDHYGREL